MPNPVLDRIMFQVINPLGSSQGTPAPKPKAKGTGITSMVTSPDTGAQELRSFANPNMQPTVSGFADGGMAGDGYNNFSPVQYGPGDQGIPESVFQPNYQVPDFDTTQTVGNEISGKGYFGGEQLPPVPYGEYGPNPGWGHEGQPMVMSREPVPMGLGPEYQDYAKQNAPTSSGGPLEAAVSQATGRTVTAPMDTSAPATGTTVTAPTNNSAPAPSSRYKFDSSKFMQGNVSPTSSVQNPYYMGNRVSEAQMRGIASVAQPTGNFYRPSFSDIPQGYAYGGSVRNFKIGGYNDAASSGDIPVFVPEVPPVVDESKTVEGASAPYVPKTPAGRFLYDPFAVTPSKAEAVDKKAEENRIRDKAEKVRLENPPPNVFSEMTEEEYREAQKERQRRIDAVSENNTGPANIRELATRRGFNDTDLGQLQAELPDEGIRSISPKMEEDVKPPVSKMGEEQGPPMPSRASEREKRSGKGGLDLLLEDIKNRRAASAEEKENNKWMALMQAGLAIAGGRSQHALQNIGVGGLQGAQAYAASEKDRRAEDRALFGEEAQVRLAQEKMAESADERAAQREMLASRDRERLHERGLTREQQAHDRGIAALNTAAGQTRQELNDISNQLSRLDGEIRRYELTMATDPEVSKAAIARLNQEKQAYADRAAEVRSRQDELLGLQGRKVPDRGPPSLSLPNGEKIVYRNYTAK